MKCATRIIMIRHGETQWNVECRLQGCQDSPLTEAGLLQADNLNKYLHDTNIDCCYCSPLPRAVRTAEIALRGKNIVVHYCDAMREINLGLWEGGNIDELVLKYPQEFSDFLQGKCGAEAVGGESLSALQKRMLFCLQDIVSRHQGQTVAIVSHGLILRCVMCALENVPLNSRTYKQSNGSVNIVEYSDGNWKIVAKNYVPFAKKQIQYDGNSAILQ